MLGVVGGVEVSLEVWQTVPYAVTGDWKSSVAGIYDTGGE